MDNSQDIKKLFELNWEEVKVLTLANMLKVLLDIEITRGGVEGLIKIKNRTISKGWYPKEIKMEWYQKWIESFKKNLNDIKVMMSLDADMTMETIKEELSARTKCIENEGKKFIILTEMICFVPYGKLEKESVQNLDKVKMSEPNSRAALHIISDIFGVDVEISQKMQSEAKNSIAELGGKWKKWGYIIVGSTFAAMLLAITGGILVPAIGVFVGGLLGFHGAAAMSAGLALLGGGAIAAGGAGMAGGTAAIVCGGALLGAGGGGAVLGALLSLSKDKAILDAAKIEVMLKQYFLEYKRDKEQAISLYEHFRKNMFDMFKLRDDIVLGKNIDIKKSMSKGDFADDFLKTEKLNHEDQDGIKNMLEKTLPIYEDSLGRQREAIVSYD